MIKQSIEKKAINDLNMMKAGHSKVKEIMHNGSQMQKCLMPHSIKITRTYGEM